MTFDIVLIAMMQAVFVSLDNVFLEAVTAGPLKDLYEDRYCFCYL